MSQLAATYEWARTVAVDPLLEFVADADGLSLIAVGSGGSATAASLAALLHRTYARASARNATPLDLLLTERTLNDQAVLLLSASGKNRDVLAAVEHCLQRDVRAFATLSTRVGSPLADAARRVPRAHVFDADAPAGKDGFLATNSLLATCILICRAYGAEIGDVLSSEGAPTIPPAIKTRPTVEVLYGGWGAPVATDLESKLNESALASARLSDYRNFGHGRHLWLARRPDETAVILVVTPDVADLAARTRSLIPTSVPVVEFATSLPGAAGTVALLPQVFRFVGALGELNAFDPGRPTVPPFGRKLYRLAPPATSAACNAPVTRKLAALPDGPFPVQEVASLFDQFLGRLHEMKLAALVLDYDGTLCTRAERSHPLRADLADELLRILRSGVAIGIATGRGRSVREALQRALPPKLWPLVAIGYYNGGEIAHLGDNDAPDREAAPLPPLAAAARLLNLDPLMMRISTLTVRARQITIEPKVRVTTSSLLRAAANALAPIDDTGVHVVASAHSVDVLPAGVTKLSVVNALKKRLGADANILCIGDRGASPGNDSALLSHFPSLSVDEVSSSTTTCWNLAPFGVHGPDAALRYLRAMSVRHGSAVIDLRNLWAKA